MAAFPTITRRGSELHNPVVGDFDDTMAHNPAIRSQSEGGYVTSRARFTRISRKWTVHYKWLTTANKDTIKSFEEARRGGSESFTWLNPADTTTYTVRFLDLAMYRAHDKAGLKWWMAEFVLEEV